MSKSREIIAGVTLLAAVSGGAAACGNTGESSPQRQAEIPFSFQFQKLAGSLLKLAKVHNGLPDRAPYSIDFSVPTSNSGGLGIEVQTSTPDYNPNNVDSITINQNIPIRGISPDGKTRSFNVLFLANKDGKWNEYCSDNSGGVASYELNETVTHIGKTIYHTPDIAKAVLSDEIFNTQSVVKEIESADQVHSAQITALEDPCYVNLG